MKKTERFTDVEWEKIASLLSGENNGENELLKRFNDDDPAKTAARWNDLTVHSNDTKIDVDKAWKDLSERIILDEPEKIRSTRLFNNRFLRIAASLLILLSVGLTLVYLEQIDAFARKITYTTGEDQKNQGIILPDGSEISLNRNSSITYRSNFGKSERNVKLTGEAFFNITPDASRPFVIDAGHAAVKVVGTSFNVITNTDEVEVFVKTGKVMLSDESGKKSFSIDPGYIGRINSKSSEKTFNNNPNYLSWNTGVLVYDGQKLDVVFKDLKRVYNMDISADDPSILDNLWTSPIDNQQPETIIRLICASFNLGYTKDGNEYHLSKK